MQGLQHYQKIFGEMIIVADTTTSKVSAVRIHKICLNFIVTLFLPIPYHHKAILPVATWCRVDPLYFILQFPLVHQ